MIDHSSSSDLDRGAQETPGGETKPYNQCLATDFHIITTFNECFPQRVNVAIRNVYIQAQLKRILPVALSFSCDLSVLYSSTMHVRIIPFSFLNRVLLIFCDILKVVFNNQTMCVYGYLHDKLSVWTMPILGNCSQRKSCMPIGSQW